VYNRAVHQAPLEDIASMALYAEVVQLGSFTAAAARVGLAKSAVSKRIATLEERLGVRLLTRTTRKLTLTEDGVRFYEHCAALLAAANAAAGAVAGASTTPRGPLKVNAPVTLAHMFLADALVPFLARYPDIELQLSTEDKIVDVVEGGYDVVVRVSRLDDSSLVARRLAADRLVVCAAPSYLDAHGRPATPGDLIAHNCLHYSLVPRDAEWRYRGAGGRPYSVTTRGNLTTSDGSVLRRAALAGLGLAVLPLFMVAADVSDGTLELVLEGARKAEIGIYAVYASRKQLPARTKLLLDHLVTWFSWEDWRLQRRSRDGI
jgi:DNA-binding transcriptional LysR family regulator